ncbi:AMP binding protein [Mycena alexandri]|uniref:AMP binding protein n=1 Tax=Mycena alexandri TaxID=1745969 RepID=A0AAD6SR09_9AGAR|nr:AMP binding protein [Mycena alexandri]
MFIHRLFTQTKQKRGISFFPHCSLSLHHGAPHLHLSFPDTPIFNTSIFTRVFQAHTPDEIGGFPTSKKAFIDGATETSLTRAELLHLYLSFCHGIRDHPVTAPLARRGDTTLMYSQNSLAWPVVLFGCIAAGLRCTLANNAYVSRELTHQYLDSGAKLLATAEDGIDTGARWKLKQEEQFEGALAHETTYLCYSSIRPAPRANPRLNFKFHLLWKSLTVPTSQGVETTHQNMTTIMDIVRHEFPRLQPGNETVFGILPFYHIYAVDKFDISSLEYMLSAAAPLGADLVKQVKTRLLAKRAPGALCAIAQGRRNSNLSCVVLDQPSVFQSTVTETTTGTHFLVFNEADRKVGSVGALLANLEARIVDDEDGTSRRRRGNLESCHHQRDHAGWMVQNRRHCAEGFYCVVDRRKKLIKYKVVPPAELEALLLIHPVISDAAVIGVVSLEQATELPRCVPTVVCKIHDASPENSAYVVHARPQEIKTKTEKDAFAEGVAKWMESRVAKHKLLRGGVSIIEAVPESAAGKIRRFTLFSGLDIGSWGCSYLPAPRSYARTPRNARGGTSARTYRHREGTVNLAAANEERGLSRCGVFLQLKSVQSQTRKRNVTA